MPKTIEQRLGDLEETMKLLYLVVIEGKPYIPGREELNRALEAMLETGDMAPLSRYLQLGGVIPKAEILPKNNRRGKR